MPKHTAFVAATALVLALTAALPANAQFYPTAPPPAPQVEVVPPLPPGPMRQIWRPGHWRWSRAGWVWVPGHYARPPRPTMVWVPGEWVARGPRWIWVGGHWR